MPLLLLTRPEPASRRFARQAEALGAEVVISPILRIEALPHDGAALADAPGLVFTSENAVPFAGPGRGRPAICVGPHSAAVARAAGFDAITGPGDAIRLEPMLKDLPPGWLHPHGRHIARALPVEGVAVYDQQPVALNDRARAALAGGGPVMVPLFSPRSARLLSAQVQGARAALWVVPISAAAAGAWDGPAARMAVAPTPDAEGMLAGLAQVMAAQHS